MTLFEITTGVYGESYERCYVWAANESVARHLFESKYPKAELRELTQLFDDTESHFVTNLSSGGFDTDDVL